MASTAQNLALMAHLAQAVTTAADASPELKRYLTPLSARLATATLAHTTADLTLLAIPDVTDLVDHLEDLIDEEDDMDEEQTAETEAAIAILREFGLVTEG